MDPARRRAIERCALALVVAWVAIVTYHPHFNAFTGARDPFPVHADEYVHWGQAAAIAEHGTLDPPSPFSPTHPDEGTNVELDEHERAFQAYVAVLQRTTGLDWPTLLTLAPTAMAILATLAVYLLGNAFGAGLPAALWFSAVPTSLRFLGPGFLVPIAFALPLVALALYLLAAHRTPGGLAALVLLLAAVWTIHVAAALTLTIVALAFALASARWSPWSAAALVVAIGLPLLFAHGQLETLAQNARYKPILPLGAESARLAGVVLYGAAAVGAAALALSREPSRRAMGIGLAVALVALLWIVAYRANTGIDPFRAYDRATLLAAFVAVPLAGAGVAALARWLLRAGTTGRMRLAAVAAVVVIALVQVASVGQAVRDELDQAYYVSMTREQYDAWSLAAERLDERYTLALVQGPTMPFSIVTGIPTAYVRSPEDLAEPEWVTRFFLDGANDTRLLVETGITVVATTGAVRNPDLTEVAPGVYALREDYVDRMAQR